MTNEMLKKMVLLRSRHLKETSLLVTGDSMLPVLRDGDRIFILKDEQYHIGDLVVFPYKFGNILVHRLLAMDNGRYYIKGDNAFRLEDVGYDQIIGKVIKAERNGLDVILEMDETEKYDLVQLSLQVNQAYVRAGYNQETAKLDSCYIQFQQRFGIKNKT